MKKLSIAFLFLLISLPVLADTIWLGPSYFLSDNKSNYGVSMKTEFVDSYLGYSNSSTNASGVKTGLNTYTLMINGKINFSPRMALLLGGEYSLHYANNYDGNNLNLNVGLQYKLTSSFVVDFLVSPLAWHNLTASGSTTNTFKSGIVTFGVSYLFPVHPVYDNKQ